jgi:hypothetical protein
MLGKNKPQNRHSIHGIPTSVTERRVGNVGPLIIQAAKQGSKDNLEFLLSLPGGILKPAAQLALGVAR